MEVELQKNRWAIHVHANVRTANLHSQNSRAVLPPTQKVGLSAEFNPTDPVTAMPVPLPRPPLLPHSIQIGPKHCAGASQRSDSTCSSCASSVRTVNRPTDRKPRGGGGGNNLPTYRPVEWSFSRGGLDESSTWASPSERASDRRWRPEVRSGTSSLKSSLGGRSTLYPDTPCMPYMPNSWGGLGGSM